MTKKDDIAIKGQIMDFKTARSFNFVVVIKDEWAITTADNKNFLKKMAKQEQKAGNKFIKYLPSKGWVIQHYKGKTKKQISDEINKNLKRAGANLSKE